MIRFAAVRWLPTALAAAVALAPFALATLAPQALAQDSRIQQLGGDYFGLTLLGVVRPEPEEVRLSIEIQEGRRFLGTLSYVEQENLIIAGTIAKSGQCQIAAESDEAQTTIHLDWQDRGGGAATLTGDLALTIEKEKETGPVVFLRPFDERAIDWSAEAGRYPATFTSAAGGEPIDASFDLIDGARGILQATIPGWIDPDQEPVVPDPPGWINPDTEPVVIGTTSAGGGFIAVGVGSGANQITTFTGNVTTDRDGRPVSIDGSYLIEHTTGKLIDLGTFSVLLAP